MEIVRTKIIIPKRRSDLLSRPRLLQLFHNLDEYKLSILTAPPGYGKTSLLIDAAHTLGVPFCWYTLDALDQDTTRFLTHFIASIKQRFKRFGQQSLALLENARSDLDIDQLTTVLTNEIFETISGRFIVAIDDYHLVDQNQEINYFVNQFTQFVDDNCHLAISSRVPLPLPDLSLFIVRGQANGISFEELAFNKSEIQLLMLRNYDTQLTDNEADSLHRETEGWITGLLLSSQVQQQHEMVDRLRLARASGIGLYDYLADQVLNQQPEPVREFLLQSSLLEEFNAALCERVYGSHHDWPQLITTLLQTNLFVIPVENDEGLWIRYHHLFQEFLRNRMEQHHPARAKQIRQRLAEIYMEQEQWERAYDLYRQLNDTPKIIDLIKRANYSLLKNGHQATLVKWIDALDDFRSEPEIMALRGFLTINFGQNGTGPNPGLLYLDRAVEALRDSPVKLSQVLIWRARVNYVRANYAVSLQDIDKALELLLIDEQTNLYVDALRYKGMNLIDLGRPSEAIALLEEAATVCDETTFSYINMALGIAYENTGSYEAAKRTYNKALAYWNETHNGPLQAFVLNNIAVIQHYSGNYVDAATCLEQSIYYSRQYGNKHSEATAIVSLCDLYKDLDISTEIIEALETTQGLVTEIGDMFLQFYIHLLRAFAQKANPEAQLASLRQARDLAEASNSNYQLGLYKRVAGQLVLATQPQQAISLLTSAIEEHFDQTQKVELAVTKFFLAIAYKIIHNDELATFYLQKTLELAKQLESQHLLIVSGRSARLWLESFLDYGEFRQIVSTYLQKIDDFDDNIPRL